VELSRPKPRSSRVGLTSPRQVESEWHKARYNLSRVNPDKRLIKLPRPRSSKVKLDSGQLV